MRLPEEVLVQGNVLSRASYSSSLRLRVDRWHLNFKRGPLKISRRRLGKIGPIWFNVMNDTAGPIQARKDNITLGADYLMNDTKLG